MRHRRQSFDRSRKPLHSRLNNETKLDIFHLSETVKWNLSECSSRCGLSRHRSYRLNESRTNGVDRDMSARESSTCDRFRQPTESGFGSLHSSLTAFPVIPTTEAMLMMRPPSILTNGRVTACDVKNAPDKFVAKTS